MPFPFTSSTIGKLIIAIDAGFTGTQIGTLLLECGADGWEPEHWPNKQARLQATFANMRRDGDDAARAALELAAAALREGAPRDEFAAPARWWEELKARLEADGWDYKDGRMSPVVPGLAVAEVTSALEDELEERGWTIPAGHYRQALENFGGTNWAATNAQLRSLLESFLPAAAGLPATTDPQAVLDRLRGKGVLVEGEHSMAKGLWSMCQPRGSHPGLSDHDEAEFRLLTVTAYCRFLLSRIPR